MPAYGFKFISGKYQGGEFPIPDGGELIIGRASDADLVLSEDMVSRKHAKVSHTDGVLSISDLGSTNGTFVNGEKIRKASLRRNDRVLVGTSILRVTDGSELSIGRAQSDREALKVMMTELGARERESSSMSGDLEEVPLPDLLQLFASNRKSGVLVISGNNRGKLFIKDGQLRFAVIHNDLSLRPQKSLFRMMAWKSGTFRLEPYDDTGAPQEAFSESTESLIMEALRQQDEMGRLLSSFPDASHTLSLCLPMTPKLSELSKAELDTLQLVLNFGQIQQVLDKSPTSDFETMTCINTLLERGYLEDA